MSYENSRGLKKLELISELSTLDSPTDILSKRCKFNFHYFDPDNAGQDFKDWNLTQLVDLLNKLKNYSENSLFHWQRQPIGKGKGNVLEIYGDFPLSNRTDFSEPKYIPIDVKWGRFRLGSARRLVGFIIPDLYHDKAHPTTGFRFDRNTFYIVFLDKNHKFYKTEK